MLVKINIDGKDYEVEKGANLLEACGSVGIDVPHFCYHPGLGPDGNCRMCQVELVTDRGRQLVISCNTKVGEGMIVDTKSERVRTVRAGVEEFLLLNHPLDCPICDKAGECALQNYYMAHDRGDSFQDFPRAKKRKAMSIGKTLVLDQERCVLCDRCVRFLRDIAGSEELYIAGRGDRSHLTTFPGREVTSPYSLNTVDLCPVGALTSKDFRFHLPVWFLKTTRSVCTTCERGCSIEIDHRDGKIYRLRPRHNPDVNGYWMCDEGRLNYKFVNDNRVEKCGLFVTDELKEISYEEALYAVRDLICSQGDENLVAGNVLLLASATSTHEELFLMKKLRTLLEKCACYVVEHVPDGEEDELLRRKNRHPNSRGARLLGMEVIDLREIPGGNNAGTLVERLAEDGVILASGFDYGIPHSLEMVFEAAKGLASISACRQPFLKKARVVIPAMTFAEKQGVITNFQGQAQYVHTANVGNNYVPEGFDMKTRGISQWKVLSDLIKLLGGDDFADVKQVRASINEEEAFFGIDLNRLGDWGIRVKP